MKNRKLTEKGIRRVVWIPEKLDQEIEYLRHNIGYTRSGFYRYVLTRLMEQLLLTKQKQLTLQPWDEITGLLKAVKIDNQTTTAFITCTQHTDFVISYPNETKEAQNLQTLKQLVGQKVKIIRTDIPEKPLLINVLRNNGGGKNFFRETVASLKDVSVSGALPCLIN